jgi:hypothetical protein
MNEEGKKGRKEASEKGGLLNYPKPTSRNSRKRSDGRLSGFCIRGRGSLLMRRNHGGDLKETMN